MSAKPADETPFEAELRGEKVSVLRRTGEQLELALNQLELSKNGQADLVAAARREVGKRLWEMMVVREAVGLRNHREIFACYRIPGGIIPNP